MLRHAHAILLTIICGNENLPLRNVFTAVATNENWATTCVSMSTERMTGHDDKSDYANAYMLNLTNWQADSLQATVLEYPAA